MDLSDKLTSCVIGNYVVKVEGVKNLLFIYMVKKQMACIKQNGTYFLLPRYMKTQ